MMKRGILCFVLAAFLAVPAVAAAEVQGVYIAPKFLLGIQNSGAMTTSGMGGVKPFKQYSQAVFGGALAAGYNLAPQHGIPVRTEIEFALRSQADDKKNFAGGGRAKQTTNLSTLFFNAYFDFDTGTPVTPYVGGGLGMAFNNSEFKINEDVDRRKKSSHDTTFAWNLGLGAAYAFTENVALDLGYRFVYTGHREVKFRDGTDRYKVGSAPHIHEFILGARFTF